MAQSPDILGSDPRPAFFPVANASDLGLKPPESLGGIPVRTWVRSLSGMQKEALVVNGATGTTWRLVSDEGPYLASHDRAPCPLCHFVTGMAASYLNEICSLAKGRGLQTRGMRLTLDNFYTMEGSALIGTMTGGALNPGLSVEFPTPTPEDEAATLVAEAVAASPVHGLLANVLSNRFTLHHNGEATPVGQVAALTTSPLPDPGNSFEQAEVAVDAAVADDLMVMLRPAEQVDGVPGGVNTSLQESQSRNLHARATCVEGVSGVRDIMETLISPIGSEFRFRSDETGMAPDAVTYLSAGIGFCFLTQLGRYARITRKVLDHYRIAQDTVFHPGEDGQPGRMDPVETHLYLETPEDVDFARQALDMSEQTCFLHATCRTPLGIEVDVSVQDHAPAGDAAS